MRNRNDDFTRRNPIIDDLEEIDLPEEPIMVTSKVIKNEVKQVPKPISENKIEKIEPISKISQPISKFIEPQPSPINEAKVEKIEEFKMQIDDSQDNKNFMDNLNSSFNDESEDDRYKDIF